MSTQHDNYIDLVERITRIETEQHHAEDMRTEMSKDIKDTKQLLATLVNRQDVRDAKFGGVLWAASAMAAFISTFAKLIWDWLKQGSP